MFEHLFRDVILSEGHDAPEIDMEELHYLTNQAVLRANGHVSGMSRDGRYDGRSCDYVTIRKNGGSNILHMAHPLVFSDTKLDPESVRVEMLMLRIPEKRFKVISFGGETTVVLFH